MYVLFLGFLWVDSVYAFSPTRPALPIASLNKLSNIIIVSNSSSVYSIPSTFVTVDIFGTTYTIAGKISSLNDARDLITSTIVNDFDKNPNIGYVVKNSTSGQIHNGTTPQTPQPSIPNPFVSKDLINQKIANEVQHAIAAAAAATSATEKPVEIKCTFGMILGNYKCS